MWVDTHRLCTPECMLSRVRVHTQVSHKHIYTPIQAPSRPCLPNLTSKSVIFGLQNVQNEVGARGVTNVLPFHP